ncbi:decaprenyl-phosphate phosphoribosyltransferase [Catenulispora sp. NF23]|uniref:Decaprenyl-phosphate phosphoribosyltransferase n=1 Tax=Catenulispora pinistramenti TaxID=2705254 RepID=A0ABS5L7J5_9ACTN|nr:decaprenyl-phosphate phosphoribosyltransferase [Catenulispora pinistramenti]MBS2538458.1 decaprenyl-phosphate phosphoribosyltransferase [Catenulispora pinistramenti]MBS2554099.1 decaprenyl-phosphate phosphoribosyltransferase [Catenulispora pinistramenti]
MTSLPTQSAEPQVSEPQPATGPTAATAAVDALAEQRKRPPLPVALVLAARPRQWVKNVLVLAAPLSAAKLGHADVLRTSAIAFVAFCLAASCIYFVNDVMDVESDRRHPKKRFRPIAAGWVSIPQGLAAGAVCGLAGLGVAAIANWTTVLVVAVYMALHIVYSLWFKHVPVLDLAMVASGFLLRAIVGGVAANLELSQWFLLTTGFGSLFMVAGKRYSEMVVMGEEAAASRKSLKEYSQSYLRFVWQAAATVTMVTYSLWAFQLASTPDIAHKSAKPWLEVSVIPWVFIFLRYSMFIDNGKAGEPEDVVLKDRVIMGIGAVWLVVFATGVILVGARG